jgi:ABC-type transport system substrate-binding protein
MTPKESWLKQFGADVAIMDETLQKADDPVAELKKVTTKLVVIVPAEYNWPPNLNPFKNPLHKRVYDAELLAQHLEEAGFTYVLRLLTAGQWSWLTAEGVRK